MHSVKVHSFQDIVDHRINVYRRRYENNEDLWTGEPVSDFLAQRLQLVKKQNERIKKAEYLKTALAQDFSTELPLPKISK